MARGVRPQLRAVESEHPEANELGLPAQPQRLHEQLPQRLQVTGPEAGDRAVVRLLIGAEHPHRHITVARPLQLARGDDPVGVAVDKQLDHQARVIGRIATLLLVAGVDRRQIERPRLHQIGNKVRQITLRHPLRQHRSHQQHLIGIVGPKRLLLAGRPRLNRRDRHRRLHLHQPPLHRHRRHDNLRVVDTQIVADPPDGSNAVTDPGS